MGHGVDRARDGHRPRQGGGELDVVEDRVGQDLGPRSGGLLPAGRLPEHRRELRAGVRGRHHQVLDAQARRHGLAESGGRAAADRDHRISPMTADDVQRPLGHLDRGVRHRAGELADRSIAEQSGHPRGQLRLTPGTEDDGAADVHPVELGADRGDRADPEDDALGRRLMDERPHRTSSPADPTLTPDWRRRVSRSTLGPEPDSTSDREVAAMTQVTPHGLHHVTAIATDPQANVDFYTRALGLRLVKQTVNFDAPETYHLYYGDERGTPSSLLTFFPWPGRPAGSAGRRHDDGDGVQRAGLVAGLVARTVQRTSRSTWTRRAAATRTRCSPSATPTAS